MSFTISYNEKTPFQAIKRKSSKSLKIEIFPKGLTHGFRTKMAIFRNFFFQPIQARKMSFTIFYNEKTPFQAMQKGSKSRKIDIFPKGLTHGFGPKIAIFSTFFSEAIQARKMCFIIFQNEKILCRLKKKKRCLKSRKIYIFPKVFTHGFGPKIKNFSNFFYQTIQARKMSFMIFQNEKTPFQAIKTRS